MYGVVVNGDCYLEGVNMGEIFICGVFCIIVNNICVFL